MNLEQMLETGLRIPGIKSFFPIILPCFTWYLVSTGAGLLGNGEETELAEQYQVDIWCVIRDEAVRLTEQARKVIMSERFNMVPTISYGYDTNGKLWRGTIMFYHVKEDN